LFKRQLPLKHLSAKAMPTGIIKSRMPPFSALQKTVHTRLPTPEAGKLNC